MKIILNFFDNIEKQEIDFDSKLKYEDLTKMIVNDSNYIYNCQAVIIIYLGSVLNKLTDFSTLPDIIQCAVFIDNKLNHKTKTITSANLFNNLIVQRQLQLTNNLISSVMNRRNMNSISGNVMQNLIYQPYDRYSNNYTSISGEIINGTFMNIDDISASNTRQYRNIHQSYEDIIRDISNRVYTNQNMNTFNNVSQIQQNNDENYSNSVNGNLTYSSVIFNSNDDEEYFNDEIIDDDDEIIDDDDETIDDDDEIINNDEEPDNVNNQNDTHDNINYLDISNSENIVSSNIENVNNQLDENNPENVYIIQISLLNTMGYFDNNLNRLALESVNGNVNDAIDFIESLR